MVNSESVIVQTLLVVVPLFCSAFAHTVYKFPEKQAVPLAYPQTHAHPHPHPHSHGQAQTYKPYSTYPRQQPHQQQAYGRDSYKEAAYQRPYAGCQYNGDIMKNPNDRCSYLECYHGEEPWYNQYGKAQLYVRVRHCPPGTAVAQNAKEVLFRPIQYDPTRRVYQGSAGTYQNQNYANTAYGHQSYKKQSTYEYKNSYSDATAICSQVVEASSCKAY